MISVVRWPGNDGSKTSRRVICQGVVDGALMCVVRHDAVLIARRQRWRVICGRCAWPRRLTNGRASSWCAGRRMLNVRYSRRVFVQSIFASRQAMIGLKRACNNCCCRADALPHISVIPSALRGRRSNVTTRRVAMAMNMTANAPAVPSRPDS